MNAIIYKVVVTGGSEVAASLAKCSKMCERIATTLAPPMPACECGAELHPGVPHEEALLAEHVVL